MFHFHTDRHAYHTLLHNNAVQHIIPFIEKQKVLSTHTRVLEIGSGDGGNLSAFLTLGCKVVGVELDAGLVAFTREKLAAYVQCGQLTIISGDIYEIDVDTELGGRFDLILLKDVIEHIHDQPRLFSRMRYMLKPKGMIFFAFPPWQMPYGGHQQICRHRLTSKLPWYHLLPRSWYAAILKKI